MTPAPDLLVVRYGEIFLKGANRPTFLERLRRNLARAVAGTGWRVQARHGRYLILPEDPAAPASHHQALRRALRTFGVTSVSPSLAATPDLDDLRAKAVALARAVVTPAHRTFRATGRRRQKTLPYTSIDLGRIVGDAVGEAVGLDADMRSPDLEVGVEVGDPSFVCAERLPGPGGLPVGVSGRVAVLLSGGIDSPVAAWMAMKRGCEAEGVYLHSFPLVGDGARDKVLELAGVLAAWNAAPFRVHVVPFAKAQEAVRDACEPRLYVLLYRRLMLRIAERVARRISADALVTGESVGQVASQTLANLDVIGAVAGMPVLRPLVCMDKQEAVDRAKAIGTFDISARRQEDCCSLFVPRHPETRGRRRTVERAEAALDVGALVEEALDGTTVVDVPPAAL